MVLDRSVGGITAGPDGNLWFAEGFRQGANIRVSGSFCGRAMPQPSCWRGNSWHVPVAADYDGDGTADLALYWPQTGEWFIRYSVAGMTHVTWGCATCGDIPVPAKY